MTPEKLNELAALESKATPRPWKSGRDASFPRDWVLSALDEWVVIRIRDGAEKQDWHRERGTMRDLDAICALRNSAAELIADSRKLRKLEEAAREMLNALDNATSPDDWSTSELREALADCAAGPVEG